MTRLACRVRVPLWSLTSGMSVFSLQNALSLGYDRFCSVCVERAPQRARRARPARRAPTAPRARERMCILAVLRRKILTLGEGFTTSGSYPMVFQQSGAQDVDLGGGFHYLR